MIGKLTTKIVQKAYEQIRGIRRDYMAFARQTECVRIVMNPTTLREIKEEFWREYNQRGPGVHNGYWIEDTHFSANGGLVEADNRMLGLKIMTDETVPEGEIEIRAILAKTWEPVN